MFYVAKKPTSCTNRNNVTGMFDSIMSQQLLDRAIFGLKVVA
jgi:hypothetical protein